VIAKLCIGQVSVEHLYTSIIHVWYANILLNWVRSQLLFDRIEPASSLFTCSLTCFRFTQMDACHVLIRALLMLYFYNLIQNVNTGILCIYVVHINSVCFFCCLSNNIKQYQKNHNESSYKMWACFFVKSL